MNNVVFDKNHHKWSPEGHKRMYLVTSGVLDGLAKKVANTPKPRVLCREQIAFEQNHTSIEILTMFTGAKSSSQFLVISCRR